MEQLLFGFNAIRMGGSVVTPQSLSLLAPAVPSSAVGSASGNFTVTLVNPSSSVVVTPHSALGATVSPATLTLSSGSNVGTFTITPVAEGYDTVTITNGSGVTDPSAVSYLGGGYSTLFPLTENPLSEGGVWTDGSVYAGRTAMRSDGVHAFGTMVSFDGTNYIDSCAHLFDFPPNQRISGVVYNSGAIAGLEIEQLLCASFTSSGVTAYELDLVKSSGLLYLVRWNGNGNDFTYASASPFSTNVSMADGDVWVSQVSGGLLTVTCNGLPVITNLDLTTAFPGHPALLVGSPGIGAWCETNNTADPTKFGWKSIHATVV